MRVESMSRRTAFTEKHLVNLLHENRSLEQAIENLDDTINRLKISYRHTSKSHTREKEKLNLVQEQIPHLISQTKDIEGSIRACFRFPNLLSVQKISRDHNDCIQTWNKIQMNLQNF